MLQSEVGSAKLNPAHSFPARGRLMCDFTLPSAEGGQVSLYDYRGHAIWCCSSQETLPT
jgi:hypothetical protein